MELPDGKITLHVHIDKTELDDVISKLERLKQLTEEINAINEELEGREINLSVNIEG